MCNDKNVYCIAYINNKLSDKLERDLEKADMPISVKIPMVRILKKQFKGKQHFVDVPLMLNYGFVKVPESQLTNPEFFIQIRQKINCIVGFPKVLGEKIPTIATATIMEVKRVIRMGRKLSVFTGLDFNTVEGRDIIRKNYEPHVNDNGQWVEGKLICLKGYPFHEVDAKVCRIKFKKEEVDVILQLGSGDKITSQPATVSFANLFYSVYDDGLSEEMRENSIEGIQENSSDDLIFDKLQHKAYGTDLY